MAFILKSVLSIPWILLYFLSFLILMSIFTLLTLVILRFLVGMWIRYQGQYGKLLTPCDGVYDDDFTSENPRFYMISTLELDGDLSVEELRRIFRETVLNARMKVGKEEHLRYPEFQQYIGSILGFPVWKNEDNFDITEHIVEHIPEKMFVEMGELHEILLNRNMLENRSPWEMILIRNTIPVDASDPDSFHRCGEKTILLFKIHHIMSDFKSMMKVLVECMAKKKLNVPEAREEEMGVIRRFSFPIFFPLYFIRETWKLLRISVRYRTHPLMVPSDDDSKLVVKFTKPLEISSLKRAADLNGVTLSAALMSVIAGSVREYCKSGDSNEDLDGTPMAYILPKANHPQFLTNHWRCGINILPTDTDSRLDRLLRSESVFKTMKNPEHSVSMEMHARILGLLPRSPVKWMLCRNHQIPLAITNIAGDREGFSIGEAPCSDFRMSVGIPQGCTGVVFSILSYKGQIRIGVIGRETAIPEKNAANLANLVTLQYEKLINF